MGLRGGEHQKGGEVHPLVRERTCGGVFSKIPGVRKNRIKNREGGTSVPEGGGGNEGKKGTGKGQVGVGLRLKAGACYTFKKRGGEKLGRQDRGKRVGGQHRRGKYKKGMSTDINGANREGEVRRPSRKNHPKKKTEVKEDGNQ